MSLTTVTRRRLATLGTTIATAALAVGIGAGAASASVTSTTAAARAGLSASSPATTTGSSAKAKARRAAARKAKARRQLRARRAALPYAPESVLRSSSPLAPRVAAPAPLLSGQLPAGADPSRVKQITIVLNQGALAGGRASMRTIGPFSGILQFLGLGAVADLSAWFDNTMNYAISALVHGVANPILAVPIVGDLLRPVAQALFTAGKVVLNVIFPVTGSTKPTAIQVGSGPTIPLTGDAASTLRAVGGR